jgi:hypothetical protein
MKYVEFYKLQNDGSQKVIAICRLNDNGEVECEGDHVLVENIKTKGIKDYSSQNKTRQLFFQDGLKFLEQLKFNFTSGYLNASEVLEK